MYFIALVAPEEINEKVLTWKNYMKEHYGCVVALRSPAHITLIPPFWMDESLQSKLISDISEFSTGKNSIGINLKNFSAFKPRVIFLYVEPNNQLQQLHADLQTFLISKSSFPIEVDEKPFTAHLTIATRDLYKKAFHEAWEVFKEKKYTASWNVQGISLLRHDEKKWEVIFTSHFINVP
jgi:2'-5' RNA ligase